MTNEEAVKWLKHHINTTYYEDTDELKTALEMAIKALEQEQRTGHWIVEGDAGNGNRYCHCSECGKGDEQAKTQEVPYCWWCGARMKEGD